MKFMKISLTFYHFLCENEAKGKDKESNVLKELKEKCFYSNYDVSWFTLFEIIK